MERTHRYSSTIIWTGNRGTGTDNYKNYERSHRILVKNKQEISASSDPSFRGDNTKHNPEELFLSSLSSCHMLWYLHLCSEAGIIVLEYSDNCTGIMTESLNGAGKFSEVTLNPVVTVKNKAMIEKAIALHKKANELCFLANSVNFRIIHKPTIKHKA